MPDVEFTIEMYVTASGRCPVAEFLEELKRKDPRLHLALTGALRKIANAANHRRPLTAPLRDGILDVRAHGSAQGRVLFSFEGDRVVLLLAGFVKKTGTVPDREVETALARRGDWNQRRQ